MIIRKSPAEIDRIAKAGDLVAETIAHVGEQIVAGVTTGELDQIAERFIADRGGIPTSKGYPGAVCPFPAATCISVNDEVVHGIPGTRALVEGDVVTIDVGVTLDSAIADSAFTFPVGEVSDEVKHLLVICEDALNAGIAQATLGNRIGDISYAVQELVEDAGFSIVRSLVGHGVGRHYHEDPHVPNFGLPGRGPKLSEGMTIAIEPMITIGGEDVHLDGDGWTIATNDGSWAAHFEHTIAVLEGGPRILTPRVGVAAGRS